MRRICEVLGCDETATESRTLDNTVLDGYMMAGAFVETRRGNSSHQFCGMHAAWADRVGVEQFIADRCIAD